MRLAVTRYDHDESSHVLSEVLKNTMDNDTIIVCIGTDRVIGDALAPVVGTMLKSRGFRYPVYGTLDRPIHALNIYESIDIVKRKHPNSTIIAIDACLGKKERVGYDTQKPKKLLEKIVKAFSSEGDTVADFFCGSGTSLVVAKELGRNYIGCDINPRAIEITNERLEEIK